MKTKPGINQSTAEFIAKIIVTFIRDAFWALPAGLIVYFVFNDEKNTFFYEYALAYILFLILDFLKMIFSEK